MTLVTTIPDSLPPSLHFVDTFLNFFFFDLPLAALLRNSNNLDLLRGMDGLGEWSTVTLVSSK